MFASRCDSPTGPSPRERGSHQQRQASAGSPGSIPARAGEPSLGGSSKMSKGVHPRASGGASHGGAGNKHLLGPSPRERGSLSGSREDEPLVGSIPARAGEPKFSQLTGASLEVHPRASGGASPGSSTTRNVKGPSPRERGSRQADRTAGRGGGSIPARAGEPSSRSQTPGHSRVHPRASGGAIFSESPIFAPAGPSPRERGSLLRQPERKMVRRSIPARAGEPRIVQKSARECRVHPRASGGAHEREQKRRLMKGPSPRERGSPRLACFIREPKGSIPARAGEPLLSKPLA